MQVLKQLEPHAQKIINEEGLKLLEQQSEVQPSLTSNASNFLMLYDDEVNSADASIRAQITVNCDRTPNAIIEDEVERYRIATS